MKAKAQELADTIVHLAQDPKSQLAEAVYISTRQVLSEMTDTDRSAVLGWVLAGIRELIEQ